MHNNNCLAASTRRRATPVDPVRPAETAAHAAAAERGMRQLDAN